MAVIKKETAGSMIFIRLNIKYNGEIRSIIALIKPVSESKIIKPRKKVSRTPAIPNIAEKNLAANSFCPKSLNDITFNQ